MSEEMIISKEKVSVEVYQEPLNAFIPQLSKGTALIKEVDVIKDQATVSVALELINKSKTMTSIINKKVDEICKPFREGKQHLDEVQRGIKQYADEITTQLRDATKVLEGKAIRYNQVVREEAERAKREHEEKIREATRRQMEIEKEERAKAAAGMPSETPPAPMVIMPPPVVVEPQKIKGLLTIWKYDLIDETQVPWPYMSPDPDKIKKAIKDGVRDIPGLRIYSEQQIRKS